MPCIACDGKERDHRTIQSHLTLMDSLQETSTPTTTNSQPNLSCSTNNSDTPDPDQATGRPVHVLKMIHPQAR
jgi:hypothetical protein